MKCCKFLLSSSILAFLLLTNNFANAQSNQRSLTKPQWLPFEAAVALQGAEEKPILIDIYTDWCGWCKKLDQTTYTDSALVNYLNKHFRLVKHNAESKDSIVFRGKVFKYVPEYKANELALSLLSGKMSYPSTVFLDENFGIVTIAPGYMQAKEMLKIAQFVAEKAYLNTTWEQYNQENK